MPALSSPFGESLLPYGTMTNSITGPLDQFNSLSFRCLSLDLEVGRDDRIFKFAAVRQDTGRALVYPDGVAGGLNSALAKLDDLADDADFLLGHNLIDFDLPHLQAENPRLRLLRRPAVDTLWLNPLAFPRNPYHHLVKHYQDGQLVRGTINNPELDARLALEVFNNQQNALREKPPAPVGGVALADRRRGWRRVRPGFHFSTAGTQAVGCGSTCRDIWTPGWYGLSDSRP